MTKDLEQKYRQILETQVREKILGPGYARDVIACDADASNEILHDDPRKLYCTGVMLPIIADGSPVDEVNDDEEDDVSSGDVADGNNVVQDDDCSANVDDDHSSNADDNKSERNDYDWPESNHIGIITCVPEEANEVKLDIKYAKYCRIDKINEVTIMAGDSFDSMRSIIVSNNDNDDLTKRITKCGVDKFSDLFSFSEENKTVCMNRLIPVPDGEKSNVSLLRFDEDAKADADAIAYVKMLIKGVFYRRKPFDITHQVAICDHEEDLNDDLKLYVKTYSQAGKRYVKVIVKNRLIKGPDSDSTTRFSLFQTELKVSPVDGNLVSYTEPFSASFDSENSINEFVYRDVKNYGKGIACAAEWDVDGRWIKTCYMPRCDVKKFSNEIRVDDRDIQVAIAGICTLRNISKWSELSDDELLKGLETFVSSYDGWHTVQKQLADKIDGYDDEKRVILSRQEALLARLHDNIQYLRGDKNALECFKIANTAMLIQMVISRDPYFKKNRGAEDMPDDGKFNSINYFENHEYSIDEPKYRPFQLAFLLMNVKSTFVEDDENRLQNVDLIWFPTGGGKTEAYLALTALTIVARRRSSKDDRVTKGVSVIMRYTLRLLTSQQFERASFLICALEFLRVNCPDLQLGGMGNRITIGLWIGSGATPNQRRGLNDRKFRDFINGDRRSNPFPVAYCPWCGQKLWANSRNGYNEDGSLTCQNLSCHFNADRLLPINYIDENIYTEKPTLLFATVDKFAQLYKQNAAALLRDGVIKSPDLIIQDELHLISGPLGSTVGLFESIVEYMASSVDGHRRPKIVASTATTRNTGALIKSLYGKNREVNVFPAQGLSYDDNYFSHLEHESLRRHVGIMPTGRTTSVDTETRLTATLILSRIKIAQQILERNEVIDLTAENVNRTLNLEGLMKEDLDLFWSIVLYYNSLKDLGRSSSRLSQEIYENIRAKAPLYHIPKSLSFIWQGVDKRSQEFTSREDSSRIKDLLTAAESRTKLGFNEDRNSLYVSSKIDLVYASNMISVGIDINRWNVMVMMGQPRSTSEYIQSSSRVARSHHGLVFNLINPLRVREFSLFENYTSFHAAYYQYVEPLSATPLNAQMLKLGIWRNIVDCYNMVNNIAPEELPRQLIEDILSKRFAIEDDLLDEIMKVLRDAQNGNILAMNSLREIDPDCWTKIASVTYPTR